MDINISLRVAYGGVCEFAKLACNRLLPGVKCATRAQEIVQPFSVPKHCTIARLIRAKIEPCEPSQTALHANSDRDQFRAGAEFARLCARGCYEKSVRQTVRAEDSRLATHDWLHFLFLCKLLPFFSLQKAPFPQWEQFPSLCCALLCSARRLLHKRHSLEQQRVGATNQTGCLARGAPNKREPLLSTFSLALLAHAQTDRQTQAHKHTQHLSTPPTSETASPGCFSARAQVCAPSWLQLGALFASGPARCTQRNQQLVANSNNFRPPQRTHKGAGTGARRAAWNAADNTHSRYSMIILIIITVIS